MASAQVSDFESDYGSDFSPEDEACLGQLVAELEQSVIKTPDLIPTKQSGGITSIDSLLCAESRDSGHHGDVLIRAALDGSRDFEARGGTVRICDSDSFDPDISYPDLSRDLARIQNDRDSGENEAVEAQDGKDEDLKDDRSPLEKFRSFPKKPLSVSDLTAGAWCELQYWYTLTRLPRGRRTRTAAMKGGSDFHKKLEDEVHTSVEVDVLSKEDKFALKMWNFIQGLRTLRETGLTRELEVWGMVHGNLVNGVIDALSHENPNPEFENEVRSKQRARPIPNQPTLQRFFAPSGTSGTKSSSSCKVYLTDVKTRGSLLPVSNALLRPAKIQLLLYHRLISDMAAGRLDFSQIFHRYGLNPDAMLSDGFMAQIGNLHVELFGDTPSSYEANVAHAHREQSSSSSSGSSETATTSNGSLLRYRTLRELLPLLESEVRLAFSEGEASMGQMLRVQYIHRDDGREIDVHDFPVSDEVLDSYLQRYMKWWHGERGAAGVDVEEAFKCRSCEFATDCTWRIAMAEEHVQKGRNKMPHRRKAGEAKATSNGLTQ